MDRVPAYHRETHRETERNRDREKKKRRGVSSVFLISGLFLLPLNVLFIQTLHLTFFMLFFISSVDSILITLP